MDPLDKLELIIKGTISQKKKERERAGDKSTPLYIHGLDNQIDALSWVWTEIDAIRRSAPHVSDEIVKKMYGRN